MSVFVLHLAFILVMSHPSLLFPHGHFEINPDCHLTDDPHVLSVLSRPESAGHAPLRTCIAKFGYLAESDANTGYEPKRVRQDHFCGWWHDQRSEPQFLRLLEIHEREHQTIRCSHSVGILCFARFSWWFCTSDRRKRKHATGKPLLDREKQKKDNFLWSVLQSLCQRKFIGTVSVCVWRVTENPVLKNHRTFYSILMIEFSEDAWNEELTKLFLVKIQITEDCIWQSTTWRSKIWNEETQNTHYSSRNESLDLKDDNSLDRSSLNVFSHAGHGNYEYIYVANWRWRTMFIKKAMQEVADKLKNWKTLQSGRTTEKQRRLEEFPTQHDQESRTASLLFYTEQLWRTYVLHHALITPSSRKSSREVGMPQNTRENLSFPGNVLIVNMLAEILMNYTIIQEIWQHHRESLMMSRILRKEGIENSGSEEPLQSIFFPCFSLRARKSLDDK